MMERCPSEEVLAALVEQNLDVTVHAEVTSHVDTCDICQQVLIAAVRGGVRPSQPRVLAHGTPRISDTDLGLATGVEQVLGDHVGRFVLRRLVGAGGMGRVFEAFDPSLDRAVALKVMRAELVGRGDFAERLLRESRMMAKLAHPAVITVYEAGQAGDAVFIAMELVRGETLGAYVRRVRPAWREVARLLVQAGEGLAAAHAAGIVHRDFKPDNVLVELDGDRVKRVLVTDFGIARTATTAERAAQGAATSVELTSPGATIGTPAYMPPEQLGGGAVDARADVFAFAVTAWELLVGERPFPGLTVEALRAAIATPPRPPSKPALPRALTRALIRALDVRPAARGELAQLTDVLARVTHRSRWPFGIAAGLLALAATGYAMTRTGDAPLAPCEVTGRSFAAEIGARQFGMIATLGRDPGAHGVAVQRITKVTARWLEVHAATCPAHPSPKIATCLDARRTELLGTIDELVADPANSGSLAALIGDPRRCTATGDEPAPGLLTARVPADPVQRHRVTVLRRSLFEAEAARDRGEGPAAQAIAAKVAAEARTLYPPLEAEARYIDATTESFLGNAEKARTALRETAALAERVHADFIAANVWIQLAHTSTFDVGDPQRGLEYLAYAASAIDRLGNPPDLVVAADFTRGTTLVEADRGAEGEVVLRGVIALAKTTAPDMMVQAVQGLGYYYEDALRVPEAIAAYREALDLIKTYPQAPNVEMVLRERLASCLSMQGQLADAEREARAALVLAERVMGPTSLERAVAKVNVAQILEEDGRFAEALVLMHEATVAFRTIVGTANERYAEVLAAEASILSALDRDREAAAMFKRSCAILAATLGEDSAGLVECWINAVDAYVATGQRREIIAALETGEPYLVKSYGPDHPQVAILLLERGRLIAPTQRARAIRDMTRGVAILETAKLQPGFLAVARYGLGLVLEPVDKARAIALVTAAVEGFRTATPRWAETAAEATAWLARRR